MFRIILNQYEIYFKEGVKFKVYKLRYIKSEYLSAVKEEIDKLLEVRFIVFMEYSDWVSLLVIVLKRQVKFGCVLISGF